MGLFKIDGYILLLGTLTEVNWVHLSTFKVSFYDLPFIRPERQRTQNKRRHCRRKSSHSYSYRVLKSAIVPACAPQLQTFAGCVSSLADHCHSTLVSAVCHLLPATSCVIIGLLQDGLAWPEIHRMLFWSIRRWSVQFSDISVRTAHRINLRYLSESWQRWSC